MRCQANWAHAVECLEAQWVNKSFREVHTSPLPPIKATTRMLFHALGFFPHQGGNVGSIVWRAKTEAEKAKDHGPGRSELLVRSVIPMGRQV
jgi:hypothetical protein